MSSYAAAERAALADLFDRLGPDAPTLCEGWATRNLAAHLLVRERRPDAAVGLVAKPLAGYGEKVMDGLMSRPWPELVVTLRSGPPRWSPVNLPGADELANAVEFFVHHEDVRRAQSGWEPRDLDPGLQDLLWKRLRTVAKLLYRKARVGVVLRRAGSGDQIQAKSGPAQVFVTGTPAELMLHSFGRTSHARVKVEGDPQAVRIFATTPLRA